MVTNRARQEIIWIAPKPSKSCSDDWNRWCFWSAFRHLGTHFAENFRMSKSSWMMDPTHSREMPSCPAINLVEIPLSSKISSWIWSIISGVVTVFSRPGRGASQIETSPCLKWATQFLTWHTVVHVPLMVLSEWREFPSAFCFAGKKNLITACVSVLLKSRASPDMLPFSLCNKERLGI